MIQATWAVAVRMPVESSLCLRRDRPILPAPCGSVSCAWPRCCWLAAQALTKASLTRDRSPKAAPLAQASRSAASLVMSPDLRDTVYLGESLIQSPIPYRHVQVPTGRIVEHALRTALDDALTFGVQDAQSIPPPGNDLSAIVVVKSVHFEYHDRLQYVLPIPLPGLPLVVVSEVEVRLAFDLQLLNARGHTVQVWMPKPRATEMAEDGIVRLAHEAAWRLALQTVDDLQVWLNSQGGKP